jgi:predicted TIM-barrel fold metal-dependent hydrolase
MSKLKLRSDVFVRLRAGVALATVLAAGVAEADSLAPQVDHHQHLLSPAGAAVLNNPKHTVELPAGVGQVLQVHETAWNDPSRLLSIYSADAVTLDPDEEKWLRGRDDVAAFFGTRFARPYSITPVAYTGNDSRGHLAAYFSRGEGAERRHFGSVMIDLVRENDQWRIALEYPKFPGPPRQEPLDAERLVALLDAAQIRRAVVLSVAYWFDSPLMPRARSADALYAENLWTAEQAGRYPDRLIAFCSLNPVSEIALEALRRCAADGRFRGLKLHFANSGVDFLNRDHVRRVREVFSAANRARLPIVAHLRGGDDYGAAQARVFLEELLPAAPGVPVQIAHLWGGGGFAADALQVYAAAVTARRPATRRLYFDVSDAALVASTPELAQTVADRIRQIGLDRILYGSDAAFENHPDPQESWAAFRKGIPLTAAEFEKIASNVAPYLAEHAAR